MRKFIVLSLVVFISASCIKTKAVPTEPLDTTTPVSESKQSPTTQVVEFSKFNSVYKFSAEIPNTWAVEYIPNIESINIYDPNQAGPESLEKSVIFIRYFKANSFLTLNTVDILNRLETTVSSKAAVAYEIKKKDGIANFVSQPLWRSGPHKLIDIRYSPANPSPFYVIAHNPSLPQDQFDNFIGTLKFEPLQ